jgi:hypothetical protein
VKIFLISLNCPTILPVQVDAEISVGPKTTWAVIQRDDLRRAVGSNLPRYTKSSWNARTSMHLLGASVFFTLASAERSRRGILVKIVANPWFRQNKYGVFRGALEQLAKNDPLYKAKLQAIVSHRT